MANEEPPRTLLAQLIRAQQLTLAEAARRVEQVSAEREGRGVTVTGRHLGRLARAERLDAAPAAPLARALQATFGHPIDVLLAAYDPTTSPVPVVAVVAAGSRPATTTQEVLSMAADRARRFGQMQTASGESVDALAESVRELVQAYPNVPLHDILGDIAADQDAVFGLLEAPQRPVQSRQLYFLASVLGGMLAKASHDLSDPRAAQHQARTAWMCADAADHHGLRAWIAGLQSMIAYWARQPREALRHAQRGAPFAATARSSASVWLAANEARAWAAIGNADQAQEAIGRADAAWSRVEPDDLDELGGIATFSRPRALYYAADALAVLPDGTASALGHAERAVDAYSDPTSEDYAFSDHAGSRCDLAVARLRGGDLDGATEAVAPVLALPPQQRINGIIVSVNRVHAALAPMHEAAAAATLQEEIEAYIRTPLATLPR